MSTILRLCVSVALGLMLLTGLAALGHCCSGLDFGLDALGLYAREDQRKEELARQGRAMLARNQEKERVTNELIAGHLTLLQAAAEFRDIDEQTRLDGCPAPADENLSDEALCRNVLAWVRGEVPIRPEAEGVLRELDAQFVSHFQATSPVLEATPPALCGPAPAPTP